MPTSTFDDLMTGVAIPAIENVFGVSAVHTNTDDEEATITVILGSELVAVGDYGECMEPRTTIEIAKAHGVAIGDTITIDNDPTEDDADPEPTIWQTTQMMSDDGYMQKFAVIVAPVEAEPEPTP